MQLFRYQSVSPGFSLQKCIIKVRLGDAGFSLPERITEIFLPKCIVKVRLGDAGFSLPKRITEIFVTKVYHQSEVG